MNSSQLRERSFKDISKVYSIRNGVLFKKVLKSKHFLRFPPAIAIDKETLDNRIRDIQYIQVYDKEEELYYTVSINSFVKHSFSLDRGHNIQVALSIKFWVISRSSEIPVESQDEISLFDFSEL